MTVADRPASEPSTATLPDVAVVTTPPRRVPPAETSFDATFSGEPLDAWGPAECADGVDVAQLTEFFDRRAPMIGADYQRAYPLPNGRVLWLFQDVFVPLPDGSRLVHNAGLLQSGRCFQLLHDGTDDAPASYLLADRTERFHRWFWPLGGDLGTDGMLHVFVAEMHERTTDYLTWTEPVGTWIVTIDPADLSIVDERPAPDSSDALYGWSVVSAGAWTYLYAHCFRQFGWDPLWFDTGVMAHDWECAANVTVARIPRRRVPAPPLRTGTGAGGPTCRPTRCR